MNATVLYMTYLSSTPLDTLELCLQYGMGMKGDGPEVQC